MHQFDCHIYVLVGPKIKHNITTIAELVTTKFNIYGCNSIEAKYFVLTVSSEKYLRRKKQFHWPFYEYSYRFKMKVFQLVVTWLQRIHLTTIYFNVQQQLLGTVWRL